MICDAPIWIMPKAAFQKVPVPCGKCPNCKNRRINTWVFRMMKEAELHKSAYFVTYTYDTHHVPITPNGFMTLRKKDFQDYMKRLRFIDPQSTIKYFCAGEYGTQNKRPHYHAIIYGVSDPQYLVDAWTLDGTAIGHVYIGQVSGDSIAYTMKYIDKVTPGAKAHARDDRQREFCLMSKGIGANYVTPATKQYHRADITRMYITKESGHKIAMPRYYRDMIYSDAEKKQQTQLIADAIELAEKKEYINYLSNEYGDKFTFEQYKLSGVYQRQNRHAAQQQQKPRNL